MSGNVPGGQAGFPPTIVHTFTSRSLHLYLRSNLFPQKMQLFVTVSAAEGGRQCPGPGGRLSRRVGGGAWGPPRPCLYLIPLSTGPVWSRRERRIQSGLQRVLLTLSMLQGRGHTVNSVFRGQSCSVQSGHCPSSESLTEAPKPQATRAESLTTLRPGW